MWSSSPAPAHPRRKKSPCQMPPPDPSPQGRKDPCIPGAGGLPASAHPLQDLPLTTEGRVQAMRQMTPTVSRVNWPLQAPPTSQSLRASSHTPSPPSAHRMSREPHCDPAVAPENPAGQREEERVEQKGHLKEQMGWAGEGPRKAEKVPGVRGRMCQGSWGRSQPESHPHETPAQQPALAKENTGGNPPLTKEGLFQAGESTASRSSQLSQPVP